MRRLSEVNRSSLDESFGTIAKHEDMPVAFETGDRQQDLICLGVKPSLLNVLEEDASGLFPTMGEESIYHALPRPVILPGDCPITVKRPEAQEVIEKLWYADKSCRFVHSRGTTEGIFSLWMWISDGTEREIEKVIDENHCDIRVIVDYQAYTDSEDISKIYSGLSDSLGACLEWEQAMLLGKRVLHQFLRQCGWKIQPELRTHLLSQVANYWSQSKKHKWVLLDVHIVEADLALIHPLDPEVYGCKPLHKLMVRIGEGLEALGLFEEAAMVYEETAKASFVTDDIEAMSLLVYSGIAYKRSMDYDSSMTCYVWALEILAKTRGDNWSLNDAETRYVVSNFFSCATHFHTDLANKYGCDGQEIYIVPCFVALVRAAGFRLPHPDSSPHDRWACPGVHECFDDFFEKTGGMMKDIYSRPKIARKAIVGAFQAGTLDGFKECLLKAANFKRRPEFTPELVRHSEQLDPTAQRKKNIKMAQAFVKDRRGIEQMHACTTCGSLLSDNYLICPCKTAYYCNETCKRENWPCHKKTCATRADKCDNCGARQFGTQKLLDCPCLTVCYCCQECQEEDWEEHQKVCMCLKKNNQKSKATKKGKKKKKKK